MKRLLSFIRRKKSTLIPNNKSTIHRIVIDCLDTGEYQISCFKRKEKYGYSHLLTEIPESEHFMEYSLLYSCLGKPKATFCLATFNEEKEIIKESVLFFSNHRDPKFIQENQVFNECIKPKGELFCTAMPKDMREHLLTLYDLFVKDNDL